MYLYVPICMYMYICICIYLYILICMYMYGYVRICTDIYGYVWIYGYTFKSNLFTFRLRASRCRLGTAAVQGLTIKFQSQGLNGGSMDPWTRQERGLNITRRRTAPRRLHFVYIVHVLWSLDAWIPICLVVLHGTCVLDWKSDAESSQMVISYSETTCYPYFNPLN
jgi:hypothetical protein